MLTLSSSQPEVEDGEIINITCLTNDCRPPANIIWYNENSEFTTQITSTIQVYCKASNIEGEHVESRFNVTCRNQKLSFSLSFYSPY